MSNYSYPDEITHETRRALKIYRSVNNYTLSALEKAISEIEDSLEHEHCDDLMDEILTEHKKTLEQAIEFIEQDDD
ncbi:hypothetical protein KZX29_04455 [Moraxella osloensis]|uniref:hypothetical protein n=1 Tax=Faucicola osloensis TaxID=34062 RepID=UPI0020033485|nr:hypothetical protein [Moraxella osloensis]MCK6158049.1 hypothetical protein [Moraxella osloensis]